MSWLPWAVAGWLIAVGMYGVVTSRHLVHVAVCVSVVQSGTYVFLLAVGFRRQGTAPVFSSISPGSRPVVDPVVQALTLTDIVVGATILALLLAIAVDARKTSGSADPDKLGRLEE